MGKETLFKDIKTPETLEEFHENLRKYYVCPRDFIYVMNHLDEIKVESLNSLSDLYERCPEQTPMITPKVVFDMEDVTKHMEETDQVEVDPKSRTVFLLFYSIHILIKDVSVFVVICSVP